MVQRSCTVRRQQVYGAQWLEAVRRSGDSVRVQYLQWENVSELEFTVALAAPVKKENVVTTCVLASRPLYPFTVEGNRVLYRRRFALSEPVDTEYLIRALERMWAVTDRYVWYFAAVDVTAQPKQVMPEDLPPISHSSDRLQEADSENFVALGEAFEQAGYYVEARDGRFAATPDGGFPYMVYREPESAQLRICYRLGRIPQRKRAAACVLRCALQREMEGLYLQFDVDDGTLELCYELPYYAAPENDFIALVLKRLFRQRRRTTRFFNRLNDGCSLRELLEELGGLG